MTTITISLDGMKAQWSDGHLMGDPDLVSMIENAADLDMLVDLSPVGPSVAPSLDGPEGVVAIVHLLGGMCDGWQFEQGDDLSASDITKHYGPGNHPSGTPQKIHGGGSSAPQRISEMDAPDIGGFTIGALLGDIPKTGWAVARPGEEVRLPPMPREAAIEAARRYRAERWRMLQKPGVFWGGWRDSQTGERVFDVVSVISSTRTAIVTGISGGQDAIYNLGTGQELDLRGRSIADLASLMEGWEEHYE